VRLLSLIIISAIGFCIIPASLPAYGTELKVSSFNIEWFGYGGRNPLRERVTFDDEFRDSSIRDYMDRTIMDSDVIILQEIVNFNRFRSRIIGDEMNCRTYEHSTRYHQHVVLCHKSWLRFVKVPGDRNFKLEAVAINPAKSRPALWGMLEDNDRNPLAYVIGVHLKAYPSETATRLRQIRAMSRAIEDLESDLPVIIAGDFNSHFARDSGQRQDDDQLFNRIFEDYLLGLRQISNRYRRTYVDRDRTFKLDRIWISENVATEGNIKVYSPCGSNRVGGRFDGVAYYERNVSDHCPISAVLQLP